ncbi:hypothetical protein CJ230_10295 [Oligella urethralis]|uniref:hypothetical protein n=1 Tax=Oligella urethralis TaxID=90245 RepID=UPI000C9B7F6C|nr:hypothetical protein [Oligella urethralis]PMC16244.1 hypothetical protein CJ230_10295 [Oligella urethralis]
MFKNIVFAGAKAVFFGLAALTISTTASASAKVEQELRDYLSSMGIQDSFSWQRIQGESLADATIYGVVFSRGKGAQKKTYLIKEMDFDDYQVSANRVAVDVTYKGVTDEDGVHLLLSQKLNATKGLQRYGYQQLDDIQLRLSYDMEKTNGSLTGNLVLRQKAVLDSQFDFKTEGIGPMLEQLLALDVATIDPELILLSTMTTKLHYIRLDLKDDGLNQRMLAHDSSHRGEVEKHYQACVGALDEFAIQQLSTACQALRDYFLAQKNQLHISMTPAKPFVIAEYLPMYMLMSRAGPKAVSGLIKKVVSDLNLRISN